MVTPQTYQRQLRFDLQASHLPLHSVVQSLFFKAKQRRHARDVREVFAKFSQSFRKFFEVFVASGTCLDLFGPARMHLGPFGCVWMHSEAFGAFWKFSKKLVRKISFLRFFGGFVGAL